MGTSLPFTVTDTTTGYEIHMDPQIVADALRAAGWTISPPPAGRLKAGLKQMPNGCLEWTRALNGAGYGVISVDGKTPLTHRLAWTLKYGPIPAGMYVCHHCDNPPCAQTEPTEGYPDGHLFLGTDADNIGGHGR